MNKQEYLRRRNIRYEIAEAKSAAKGIAIGGTFGIIFLAGLQVLGTVLSL